MSGSHLREQTVVGEAAVLSSAPRRAHENCVGFEFWWKLHDVTIEEIDMLFHSIHCRVVPSNVHPLLVNVDCDDRRPV